MQTANSANISGNGRLLLGEKWEYGRFYPSELNMLEEADLSIHGNMSIFTGCSITINSKAHLSLGSGYINKNVTIDCFEKIKVGNDVVISKNVVIRDSDNHDIGSGHISAPINIGDHVWIGVNATVLKGVTIGEGSVIAAGAVVNKDMPPGVLAGGVPATVIREGVSWN